MANYHTLFAASLDLRNEEEKKWFVRHLEFCPDNHDGEDSSESRLWERVVVERGVEKFEFEWSIENGRPDFIRFDSGEETGNPLVVALVVFAFFKECRVDDDDDAFVITWADTCDKLRLDSFSGGTMVATRDGIGMCGSTIQSAWAHENIEKPW